MKGVTVLKKDGRGEEGFADEEETRKAAREITRKAAREIWRVTPFRTVGG